MIASQIKGVHNEIILFYLKTSVWGSILQRLSKKAMSRFDTFAYRLCPFHQFQIWICMFSISQSQGIFISNSGLVILLSVKCNKSEQVIISLWSRKGDGMLTLLRWVSIWWTVSIANSKICYWFFSISIKLKIFEHSNTQNLISPYP